MSASRAVTLPCASWDAVAVVLLEHAKTLKREGRTDLLVELWMDIIPPIQAVASASVQDLILEAQAQTDPASRPAPTGRARLYT